MTVPRKLLALACSTVLMAATSASRHADVDPLEVYVLCEPASSVCEAYASGGTGGNTYRWTNATIIGGGGDYSVARVRCGFMMGQTVTVTVRVTDSSGATASGVDYYQCGP